jgi:hypothetical protein
MASTAAPRCSTNRSRASRRCCPSDCPKCWPSLKGKDLTLLMSQSDMNHSRGLIDVEFTIERGANVST